MQQTLIGRYFCPIVCLTVNIPGAVKRCEASRLAFEAGRRALIDALGAAGYTAAYFRARTYETGPEAYCAPMPDNGAQMLKRLLVQVEETHPLGRLFDMDCVDIDGRPVGRRALSLPARRCMVCGGPAADCVSRQLHPLDEVYAAIEKILYGNPENIV